MRRTPAAIAPSLWILNSPISPERATCVPPHSSIEGPICSTRTLASCVYLSPKKAIAPDFTADSESITRVWAS